MENILRILQSEDFRGLISAIAAEIEAIFAPSILDDPSERDITVYDNCEQAMDALLILIMGQEVIYKGFEGLGDGIISYRFQYGRYLLDVWVQNRKRLECMMLGQIEEGDDYKPLLCIGDTGTSD